MYLAEVEYFSNGLKNVVLYGTTIWWIQIGMSETRPKGME